MKIKKKTRFGEIEIAQNEENISIQISNFASGYDANINLQSSTLLDFGCTLEHVLFLVTKDARFVLIVFDLTSRIVFECLQSIEDSRVWTKKEAEEIERSLCESDRRILGLLSVEEEATKDVHNQSACLALTLFNGYLIQNNKKTGRSSIQRIFESRQKDSLLKNTVYEMDAPIIKLATGNDFVVLLNQNGVVLTLGTGSRGELGNIPMLPRCDEPKQIEDLVESEIKIVDIACGGWHSLVLTVDHDVYAFGWNDEGQCGISQQESPLVEIPYPMNLAKPAIAIRANMKSSFVTLNDGTTESYGNL
ncbi:hypothetical protein M3Y96_00111700 [Aphelenchoides besseyi]|nr:hypothetical protein M3Y96_00111700 [Aphelenchoides besseyi]